MGMMGDRPSVESKIGRSIAKPDGDNDRPYGKCYGQVCGVSYPCTQRAPEEERSNAPSKQDYMKAKRGANGSKRVRCKEIGATFASIADAAKFAGISRSTMQHGLKQRGMVRSGGYTFEVID